MKMAKAIILILSLTIFVAQSAVLINKDIVHTRIARSPCYTCDQNYGPPPPPVFRTHNWSGYARSADGSQQGVFSGAAAAAGSGNEASGQAFSLAASDSGSANNAQNDQSTKFADKYSHGAYGGNLQNSQSNLEGFHSASTSQNKDFGNRQSNVGNGFDYGQSESGQHAVKLLNDGNFRPSAESSANAQAGGQELYRDYGSKSFLANQGGTGVQGQYQGSGHKEIYHDQPERQHSEQSQGFREKELSVNRGDIADLQQQQHYSSSSNTFTANGNSRPGAENIANAQTGGQEQYRDYDSKSFFANQDVTGVQRQNQGSGHKEIYHNQPERQRSEQSQGFHDKELSVKRGDSLAANRGEAEGQEQNKEFGQKQSSAYNSNNAGLGDYQNLGSQKPNSYYEGARSHGHTANSAQQQISSYRGSSGGEGQVQDSGSQATSQYNTNAGQEQQIQSNYEHGGYRRRSGSGRYSASEQGNEQSALSGALGLASQGLKTAETTQDGCSTCGKNSYAISNARSHSGSAVALSIGG